MGAADTGVFEVRVPSRMEALADVQSLVDQASQAFGLDEELSHWIELSVNESAINAIQHGNQLDATKDVLLRITSDGDSIEVIVEDHGDGFKLSDIPDPTDVENLLKPGGRGILIIQSFMDTVEVTKRPGGGSRLRMVKKIEGGEAKHPD